MIFPVPLFTFQEWGTNIDVGHTCPDCLSGTLREYVVCPYCLSQVFISPDAGQTQCRCTKTVHRREDKTPASMQCSNAECRAFYTQAYHRHAYAMTPPVRIGTLHTQNMPLYSSVQHYMEPRSKDGALHYADFVMDIDRDTFEEALSDLHRLIEPLENQHVPHQVYFSGSKGFHVIIPAQVLGARPAADLNHVQYRKLAALMTEMTGVVLDPAIYSRARLLRVPLTLHGKTGLYKVPLKSGEYHLAKELARLPQTEQQHYLDGPPVKHPVAALWFTEAQARDLEYASGKSAPTNVTNAPLAITNWQGSVAPVPCVREALENGPPAPGTRNKLNKVMASYFLSEGDDEEGMVDWARTTPGSSSMAASQRTHEARATYRWVKRTGHEFDCRDMKALGLCDPKCHLNQFLMDTTDLAAQLSSQRSVSHPR